MKTEQIDPEIGKTPLLQHSHQIKLAFIRKVYGLLCTQLLFTGFFCGATVIYPSSFVWVSNPTLFILSIILSIPLICITHAYKHKYPVNMILLTLFTCLETILISNITLKYSENGMGEIVGIAFLVTGILFWLLSFYTLVSKQDFNFLGGFLFISLGTIFVISIIQLFVHIQILNVLITILGIICFSGYILYDTSQIIHHLGPDDYIEATLMLYLDVINLFLYILECIRTSEN